MKLPLFAVAIVATLSSVAATSDPCDELLDVCTGDASNNCATDHICQYKGNGPSAQRGWRCREPPNNMNNIDLGVDYFEGTCSDIEFNANGEEVCYATWQGNKYVPTTTCSNPNEECLIEVDADTNGFVGTGVCKATECVGGGQGQNAQEKGAGTYRVTICHRTCSKTNPWVRITVDEDSWFGQGCGHSREHNVTEDCNHNEAERIEHWGSPDPVDYLLKAHGYKKLLNQWNQTDHDYWADWEPACPYVRSTKLNGQPCCDWAKGNCCGPRPDELVDDFPPVCGNGMIEGYGEGMEECEPELATPEGATMECSDDCKIPVCGNGVVDAPYEECDMGAANGGPECDADCKLPPAPPTDPESGTTTTAGTTPSGECPMSGIELYSVNGVELADGDFGVFGSEEGLTVSVESYADDMKSVTLEVCNDINTSSDMFVAGSFNYEFMCQETGGGAQACDVITLDCRSDKIAVLDMFLTSAPSGDSLEDNVPECCKVGEPPAVKYTFTALCYCPDDSTARSLLRGITL